jgi:Tfp pilus assembly protein PilF
MALVRFLIAFAILGACGCASLQSDKGPVHYETIKADPLRDSQTARKLNAQAIESLESCDIKEATALANQALLADVNYGPAHNTLGRIYFQNKEFYLAAWEFEHAARLMPDRAEPINNQGLVYESASQPERAAEFYQEAMALEPGNKDIIANLARVRHRMGLKDIATDDLLKQVILQDSRPAWDNWAREKSATLRDPSTNSDPDFNSFDPTTDSPPGLSDLMGTRPSEPPLERLAPPDPSPNDFAPMLPPAPGQL